MNSLVSIIIVNYNGLKWLQNCLDSLKKQTYNNFEIILVDNNSKDDSLNFIKTNYPKVVLVENKENSGFAGGNNLGYKYVKGEYIWLLNNDTECESETLENFLKAFDEIPNLGSVQSKLVLLNEKDKLDVCGSYWTDTTFLYHFGIRGKENVLMFNKATPVFSNKGASVMLKKEIIDKIGLFDGDFWSYYEETDLCNRIWSFGYECWYYPKATVYHANGGTSITFANDFIQFHNFKNKLLSFLKNFEIKNLIYIIPIYLFFNFTLAIFWLLQGKYKHFLAFFRSIWWNVIHISSTLDKRKNIQSLRKVSDKAIFQQVKKNPKPIYYKYLLFGNVEFYEY